MEDTIVSGYLIPKGSHVLKDMNTNVLCLRFGAVHVIVVACPEIAREVLRANNAVFTSCP
jgi:phenylalanine N-monooxygenase